MNANDKIHEYVDNFLFFNDGCKQSLVKTCTVEAGSFHNA